jgi:putative DNA primase/helicase
MCSPIEWRGIDEPCPHFDNYLLTSLGGNQEVFDFVLRGIGYSITGLRSERVFFVLYGLHGQNGKGLLMEILHHILGALSGPIQTEMVMAQKFTKSADGPSPAVMALKGRRLAWASEPEQNQGFADGKLKQYSGGDPLTGRAPNDKDQTTFYPTHTMWLLANVLPHAPAHDDAFWERIKVIDFPLSFVVRKPQRDEDGNEIPVVLEKHQRHADRDLVNKLKAEASGILARLVRGCIEWQKQGLNPPQKVIEDSLKYRRNEDDLQDFIDQCCYVNPASPDCKSPVSELHKRYKVWWEEGNSTRPLGIKKFGALLSMKFEKIKSSSIIYLGIMVDVTKSGGYQKSEGDKD